jgi:formylmethanofuran dehydrogenase subunit A
MPLTLTWLLDPASRPEELKEALKGYTLDLYEWARLTRLEPARCIGLSDVGHLREGARANLALYDLPTGATGEETTSALHNCWCLIKDGVLVRQDGVFTCNEPPVELRCPSVDVDLSGLAQSDLLQNATLRFEHLDVCPAQEDQAGSL